MESLTTRAFRVIQNNPGLYKIWCKAKTQSERDNMLLESAYSLGQREGYQEGYETGYDTGMSDGMCGCGV